MKRVHNHFPQTDVCVGCFKSIGTQLGLSGTELGCSWCTWYNFDSSIFIFCPGRMAATVSAYSGDLLCKEGCQDTPNKSPVFGRYLLRIAMQDARCAADLHRAECGTCTRTCVRVSQQQRKQQQHWQQHWDCTLGVRKCFLSSPNHVPHGDGVH